MWGLLQAFGRFFLWGERRLMYAKQALYYLGHTPSPFVYILVLR
jgi:hypothetical protein